MKPHAKIAIIYIAVCSLYIYTSDSIIYAISSDPVWLTTVQSYKGIAFVVLSGVFIYFMVRYYFRAQETGGLLLKETIHNYHLIFDKSPLPSYVIDAKSMKFLNVNKAAEAKFGKSQKEFLNTSILDLVVGLNKVQIGEAIIRMRGNAYSELMIDALHHDGRVLHLQIFCQPMVYLGKGCVFIISLDVSTTKDSHQIFMDKLIDSIEEERRKISGELHDGIKQYFGMVKGMLESHILKHPSTKYIQKAQEYAELGLDESRRLSHAVAPPLSQIELSSSLHHLIENINLASEVKFELIYEVDEVLSEEIAINLYRIIQEAINNIIAHSRAQKGHIKLFSREDDLFMEIRDDGIGILGNDSIPNSMESIGLNLMKTRATKLFGVFEIFSDLDKGTLIRVRVPINRLKQKNPSEDGVPI